MKEYQIRSNDLKEVCGRYPGHLEKHARREFQNEFWKMHQCKLVLAEWETEAEADKARLDWLEAAIRNQTHGEDIVFRLLMELTAYPSPVSLREVIDRYRQATSTKVTVIEEGK